MKKILMMLPDGIKNPCGGLGVHVFQVLREFQKQKPEYKFFVLGRNFDDFHKGENYEFCPIREDTLDFEELWKGDSSLHHFYFQTYYYDTAISLADSHKFDLIICYDWSTYLAGKMLRRRYDIPLVSYIQLSMWAMDKGRTKLDMEERYFDAVYNYKLITAMNETEKLMAKESDEMIFVSKAVRKEFPGSEGAHIIYNGIVKEDYEKFQDYEFPGNPENKKIVFVGRLNHQKGIHELLNAKIPKNNDLIIVGGNRGGSMFGNFTGEEYVQKYVEHNPNIFHLGYQTGQELVNIFHSADAIVMPSRKEPFGIVALEALICGTPLITTAVDGMTEFLTPQSYLKIDTVSSEDISIALQNFNSLTDDEIQAMVSEGRKVCEKFTWEKTVQEYRKVLEKYI